MHLDYCDTRAQVVSVYGSMRHSCINCATSKRG